MKRTEGVFSLYDAVLFFVFLIIASSLLTVYSNNKLENLQQREFHSDYCEETRRAILSSTVPITGYNCSSGHINRTDMSVRGLLIEEIYLESLGIDRKNFTYSSDISEIINNHISDSYTWYLEISSDFTKKMIIGEYGLQENTDINKLLYGDVITSSWSEEGLDEGNITVTLYLTD